MRPLPLNDIPRFTDRFWNRVDQSADCWLWTGGLEPDGYARSRTPIGRIYVHRIAYMLTHGEIGEGLMVLHTCDVRHCCNPSHLFLGSHNDNMRDMMSKGRHHFQKNPESLSSHMALMHTNRIGGGGFRYHGEDTPNAKLTESDIREIRRIHESGQAGFRKISKAFGVPKQHIARIVKREAWSHVK